MYKYDLNGERGNKPERIGGCSFPCRLNFFLYSNTLYSCGAKAEQLAFLLQNSKYDFLV